MNEEKVQVEMTTEEAARYEAYRKKWAEEEQQAREKADREAYRTLYGDSGSSVPRPTIREHSA